MSNHVIALMKLILQLHRNPFHVAVYVSQAEYSFIQVAQHVEMRERATPLILRLQPRGQTWRRSGRGKGMATSAPKG